MSGDFYDDHSAALSTQYQAVNVVDVHGAWISEIESRSGFACDIGARAGRGDAAIR